MDQSSQPNAEAARVILSERQIQVLAFVARGFTSKEIGRELSISPSTVDNHIRAAVDKLGARNRHDAARQIEDQEFSGTEAGRTASARLPKMGLPPIGGRRNRGSAGERLLQILGIAVLSVIVISGAILTIVGVVHILS